MRKWTHENQSYNFEERAREQCDIVKPEVVEREATTPGHGCMCVCVICSLCLPSALASLDLLGPDIYYDREMVYFGEE